MSYNASSYISSRRFEIVGTAVYDRKLHQYAPCGSKQRAMDIYDDIVNGRTLHGIYAWAFGHPLGHPYAAPRIQGMFDDDE